MSIFYSLTLLTTLLFKSTSTTSTTPTTDVIDCSQQESNCIVDCASIECRNYLLDGTDASASFTVNCGYRGCEGATIRCPTDYAANCNINCNMEHSCDNMTIYAGSSSTKAMHSESSALTLNCTDKLSCSYMNVYALDSKKTSILCSSFESGNSACFHSNWYLHSENFEFLWGESEIFCIGFGCYSFGKIYGAGYQEHVFVNVYGCDYCHSPSHCIAFSSLDIYCYGIRNSNHHPYSQYSDYFILAIIVQILPIFAVIV
eukprot:113215_1